MNTCRVAISDVAGHLMQTSWLNASAHNGPHESELEHGSWYRSYEKYGAEFGEFLNSVACPQFLRALRKELGDG